MSKMLRVNYLGELPEEDKRVYRMLHQAHCERADQPDHECQGTITIRHNTITARCPLCGNVKASLTEGQP